MPWLHRSLIVMISLVYGWTLRQSPRIGRMDHPAPLRICLMILSMRCYRFFGPGARGFVGGQDHFCLRFHPGALEKILVHPAM